MDAWKSESARNLKLYNRLSDPAYWDKVKKIDLEEAWQKVINPRTSKSEPNSEYGIMEIIVKKIQTPLNEAEQLELDLWLANSEENQNFYNEVISSDEISRMIKVKNITTSENPRKKVVFTIIMIVLLIALTLLLIVAAIAIT